MGEDKFCTGICQKTFNDLHNQRLRRGMANLGVVWYDRLPSEQKRKTVFDNATTKLIKKEVWFGPMVISGHLVRRVGAKVKPFLLGLEKELVQSESEEVFIQKAKDVWRQFRERKAS